MPFDQLTRRIAPGSTLLRTWQLSGGMSAGMTAFEIAHASGERRTLIRRQPNSGMLARNPHAAYNEFALLQQLKSAGVAVPAPTYVDETNTLFDAPYLVLEYIDGQPEFAPRDPLDFARQFATHLASIHRVAIAALPGLGEHAVSLGPRPARVDGSLGEGRIRDALEPAWPLPQHNAPVLLHGDYWPGNVLWRDGMLVAVVDWEDAAIGDPLYDLAISRLDVGWIIGMGALDAFTQQYQSLMPVDDTNLAYWDLFAVLRLIRLMNSDVAGWAAFFHPYGREDMTEQTIREHLGSFVAQAFDALEVSGQ